MSVRERVVAVILEALDIVTEDDLPGNLRLHADLEIDDIDHFMILLGVERDFIITIRDEEIAAVETVDEYVALVEAKLSGTVEAN